jgi:CRP-like cAMP-binding protein
MTERVERRVARALLRLVHEAGRRVDKGVEIDFPISRQDIAEMTGTTLFTVPQKHWRNLTIISKITRPCHTCAGTRSPSC